ncbi:MAG: VOC family protein [Planctomycetota bacterium]
MKYVLFITLLILIMQGCVSESNRRERNNKMEVTKQKEETKPEVQEKPLINVRYLFNLCNDVESMRHFYSDLLGMKQQAFMNEKDFGYLCYNGDGVQLMFFYSGKPAPQLNEWAWQPGYDGGTLHVASWAIEIPEDKFAGVVMRLKKDSVKCFKNEPEWRQDNYWGFSVMDPMGNTVEVYTVPKIKPTSKTWTGK